MPGLQFLDALGGQVFVDWLQRGPNITLKAKEVLSAIWQTMLEGLGRAGELAEHLRPDHPTETHQPKPSQNQSHGSHCNEGMCFYVFTVLHLWHTWPWGRGNGPAPHPMPMADGSRPSLPR